VAERSYDLGPKEYLELASRVWPKDLPVSCPAEVSDLSLEFTGRSVRYTDADTWFPSWGGDGAMYSPWTDGNVGNWASNSKGVCAMTGCARITGDDPLHLTVTPLGTAMGSPGPFVGRYPGASLVHRGSWYYGTYIVHEDIGPDGNPRDLLGPFVGFRVSRDYGVTWEKELFTAEQTIFGETFNPTRPIKIGSPRFVDLGQELAHSPDGKAYMISFGALRPHSHLSWILGDAVYLGRAEPTGL
jgi:hypothetical protein